jgi:hypothetical protein
MAISVSVKVESTISLPRSCIKIALATEYCCYGSSTADQVLL